MTIPRARAPVDPVGTAAPSLMHSSRRWALLIMLFAGMLFGYAHRSAFSVAVPFLSRDLNLSKASTGVLISSFFWLYSFMQVPAGWAVDRFGVRRAYSFGFIFWSVASSMMGLATGFASFLGLRVAMGAGQAVMFPASARATTNWFQDRERGVVTGIYLTGVRLGQALITWVGARFLARHDWKIFFILSGLVTAIWVLPWIKTLKRWEPPTRVPRTAEA